MKKIFILMFLSCVATMSAQSDYRAEMEKIQKLNRQPVEVVSAEYQYGKSSGELLRNASTSQLIGYGCFGLSAAIAVASASSDGNTALIGSGAVSIVGLVFIIRGITLMGSAGRALEYEHKNMILRPAGEGVGVSLSF
ncbi:hypothetical protein Barb4_01169 [Bacteroidales bacterium Barb4]|nr:hypothetical protein Barb4_01169 [Bacteroidales bacterium Barb4]